MPVYRVSAFPLTISLVCMRTKLANSLSRIHPVGSSPPSTIGWTGIGAAAFLFLNMMDFYDAGKVMSKDVGLCLSRTDGFYFIVDDALIDLKAVRFISFDNL